MIYIVLRKTKDGESLDCCLVKTDEHEKAYKMVGIEGHSTDWAVFTEDEVRVIANTKEGYITRTM